MNSPAGVCVDAAQISDVVTISVSRGYFKEPHKDPKLGLYTVDVKDREVVIEYSKTDSECAAVAYELLNYLIHKGFKVFCRMVSGESEGGVSVYVHSWLYTQLHEDRLQEFECALEEYVQNSRFVTFSGV